MELHVHMPNIYIINHGWTLKQWANYIMSDWERSSNYCPMIIGGDCEYGRNR